MVAGSGRFTSVLARELATPRAVLDVGAFTGSSRGMQTSAARYASALRTPPTPASSPSSSASNSPPPLSSNSTVRPTRTKRQELPKVPNTFPILVATVVLALSSWAGFTIYATNKEKLSSSIFKSVLAQVKASPQVQQLLGCNARMPVLKPEFWLAGAPHIRGSVNMMQGRVDLSFKITKPSGSNSNSSSSNPGSTGGAAVGTVYFTSIRAHKHAPFEILRFLVVNDTTGESVSLLDSQGFKSIDVESGDLL
ncbi:hypothetical protein BCV70DRAFT_197000 [Testicularia cyperi]|uniref:DUF1783-domain-containing protein n=1 Tax=Testicularia cyperi TaxID=1882483 RepID=A0A317XXX0_9BASI|nr:hypothetical protein BCV70DRAFT_197000 [Testicularia cyperi]